jgi:hypothetical protein
VVASLPAGCVEPTNLHSKALSKALNKAVNKALIIRLRAGFATIVCNILVQLETSYNQASVLLPAI